MAGIQAYHRLHWEVDGHVVCGTPGRNKVSNRNPRSATCLSCLWRLEQTKHRAMAILDSARERDERAAVAYDLLTELGWE